jgi:agmatinase
MPTFNPDAAAAPGSGIFGLPEDHDAARISIIPVPFDATTSYGGGTGTGPVAILEASKQVDLFDHQFGRVYECGIAMHEVSPALEALSREARAAALPIIERGGADADDSNDSRALAQVNRASEHVNQFVFEAAQRVLREGKVPCVLGGDHSTPFGSIRACAENVKGKHNEGMGLLQIDAHMDLRDAFEGFTWSHASIMFNVLKNVPQVSRLVQVGIRDYGEGEVEAAREFGESGDASRGPRVVTHFDLDWFRRRELGEPFVRAAQQAVDALPRYVYVTFDIDGLDPALCPHTGTPVPGGLSFHQASTILELLWRSGRTVVGFDLVEVCPATMEQGGGEWDANVGARILYKMCGIARGL